ncbi:MAG: HAD-IA family hydrolase [Alphaproteobacteria bacterium]|nr:HAD-IA family hydrolase [Alphaproteobacteria bacterium]
MLVIFDIDGTLIDSLHNIVAAAKEAVYTNGFAEPSDDQIRKGIGLSLSDAISRLLPDDTNSTVINKVTTSYKEAFSRQVIMPNFHEPMFDGAKECINALNSKDILLGVATGKGHKGLIRNLTSHDMLNSFVTLNTADNCPGKPHPGMIEKAMNETDSNKEETVMVGDTTFDILMGRNAGIKTIGVSWGYHEKQELLDAGAHAIAKDFSELIILLENMS